MDEQNVAYSNSGVLLSDKMMGCRCTQQGWISKIYTMEYYSAIKKKEILTFATTWIDLEGAVLSEISQPEIGKYCMISLICGI